MPRPEQKFITFEIDGREVRAPEGAMLVDAAKYGDVEIPVFCYEPKLGAPVGACRMCLVEIEGIPKLQTGCSTPVRDGMVVNTQSERVHQAQNAIVEFLLINHPLDCPVCDKGGECPLQDISYGWGAGRSRFIEPKRHFKKPLELSPLVAIDRERCILCYRCVRFSQEISEDDQLVLLERGDHTFVATHEGHPYVAPFSGNIIELCPVGALTSTAYRFRARPWDVEDSGSVCTFCPAQCNIKFTVRDDSQIMRVLARDNHEVDDGWLCDKGRFGYEIVHSPQRVLEPMVRDGGHLRGVSWERALSDAATALGRSGGRTCAVLGSETTNEEGHLLQRLMREGLGSPHIDSRTSGLVDADQARALADPAMSAAVEDIDYAGAVLVIGTELTDEAPILELRVRKATRRHGAKLVCASSQPSNLDPNAASVLRYAPGGEEAACCALAAAVSQLQGESGAALADLEELAQRAGVGPEEVTEAASVLSQSGPVVIVWGEQLAAGKRSFQRVGSLLTLARALRVGSTEGAGLVEIPRDTNARGLREVGCVPNMGPGLGPVEVAGKSAAEMAAALGSELSVLLLMRCDPLRSHPDRAAWQRGVEAAQTVICFTDFVDEDLEQYADIVFPAESYAEKEGTVTHPDGRLQRLRPAIGRPGSVRPEWMVVAELAARAADLDLGVTSSQEATEQVARSVAFYAGLTAAEIGGQGVRWQTRDQASAAPAPAQVRHEAEFPPELPPGLRLGTTASLWAGREADHAPSLHFLRATQTLQLSAADAADLGVVSGDQVDVVANGTTVRATAALRDAVPRGSVFLVHGTASDNATALENGLPRAVEVRKA